MHFRQSDDSGHEAAVVAANFRTNLHPRIAFIASSLEPQRDGVGDYTRALAQELRRSGTRTALCAINDRYVPVIAETRDEIRVPSTVPWGERLKRARSWVEEADPEWVSLQFVCYGFEQRGLCWAAGERLHQIIGNLPVHVMLHELWIGQGYAAPWKDRLIGALQRRCVLRLFDRLNVRCTHVSNPGYVAQLRREGIPARLLPLFGSVPILEQPIIERNHDAIRVLMFGAVYPRWSPAAVLSQLLAMGSPLEMWHVGHIGPGGDFWQEMARQYGDRISFRLLGPKSAEELAAVFAEVDIGLTSNSWEIAGKSAAVAAMLEHGLPVVVARDEVHYRGWKPDGYDPLLIKSGPDLAQRLKRVARRDARSRRADVADMFMNDLTAARTNRDAIYRGPRVPPLSSIEEQP